MCTTYRGVSVSIKLRTPLLLTRRQSTYVYLGTVHSMSSHTCANGMTHTCLLQRSLHSLSQRNAVGKVRDAPRKPEEQLISCSTFRANPANVNKIYVPAALFDGSPMTKFIFKYTTHEQRISRYYEIDTNLVGGFLDEWI